MSGSGTSAWRRPAGIFPTCGVRCNPFPRATLSGFRDCPYNRHVRGCCDPAAAGGFSSAVSA